MLHVTCALYLKDTCDAYIIIRNVAKINSVVSKMKYEEG
jgi:hypothetical protein